MPKKDDGLSFEEMEETPFTPLGSERQQHQPRNVFEVVLDEWIKGIDPRDYFITTGEAVQKAEVMEKELWKAAGNARRLVKALKLARAENKYLETEWREGRLLLKIKNPRKKK